MTIYALYNKGTAAERVAADLVRRLQDEQRIEAELLDADSPRGIQLAESYDVMGRPALIVIKDDGAPVQVWQGEDSLPSPADVSYLVHQ